MTILSVELNRKTLGVTGRQFQRLKRATFGAMGRDWHDRYLALHFDAEAMTRYGYTRRKGELQSGKARARSYVGRKEKRLGHNLPLVYTGEGRRLARLLDLRVTATQARVVLPRKFNFKNPKSRVDMRAELTKVLEPEALEIAQTGQTALGRELDQILTKQ